VLKSWLLIAFEQELEFLSTDKESNWTSWSIW